VANKQSVEEGQERCRRRRDCSAWDPAGRLLHDHCTSSGKTATETAADYKPARPCRGATLARAGQQRASYNPMHNARPRHARSAPGDPRETPMRMHDRVVAEKGFDKDLHDCMTDKGYVVANRRPRSRSHSRSRSNMAIRRLDSWVIRSAC